MGSNQSSSVSQAVQVLNQNIMKVVQRNGTNTSSYTSGSNQLQIQIGNLENCTVNADQSITMDTVTQSLTQYTTDSSIKALMQSSLDDTVTSLQKSQNDFLATTFGNQTSNVNIQSQLKNILNTNLSQDNINSIISNTSAINTRQFTLNNCDNSTINLGQNIVVRSFVSSVSDAIQQALTQDTQVNSAIEKLEAEQAAANKGIGDAIEKALSGLGMALIGGALLLIVVVIVAMYMMKGGSGNQPIKIKTKV